MALSNTSETQSDSRPWLQLIGLAAGLAVAVVALVASGSLSGAEKVKPRMSAPQTAPAAQSSPVSLIPVPIDHYVYLVGDDAGAERASQYEARRRMAEEWTNAFSSSSFSIFVLTTPEDEAGISMMIAESSHKILLHDIAVLRIIDLRGE